MNTATEDHLTQGKNVDECSPKEVILCNGNVDDTPSTTSKSHKGKTPPSKPKVSVFTRAKKRQLAFGEEQVSDEEVKEEYQRQLEMMKEDEEQEEDRQKELFRRWLHSPERTKKWRHMMAKMEKAEQAREEGPLADAWVQCEEPECHKWRRLTKSHFEELDEEAPWFCSMHPLPEFKSCSVPQEDFLEVERLATRLGVRYVSSSLQEGTVVWAKVPGYLRWPAIVSTDYLYGSHVYTDADDDPISYHVEFFGEQHTHVWVTARNIQLFGSIDELTILQNAAQNKVHKKRRKSSVMKSQDKTFFRTNGIKVTHSAAVREAKSLTDMSKEERLRKIVFDHKSFQEINDHNVIVPKHEGRTENSEVEVRRKQLSCPSTKKQRQATQNSHVDVHRKMRGMRPVFTDRVTKSGQEGVTEKKIAVRRSLNTQPSMAKKKKAFTKLEDLPAQVKSTQDREPLTPSQSWAMSLAQDLDQLGNENEQMKAKLAVTTLVKAMASDDKLRNVKPQVKAPKTSIIHHSPNKEMLAQQGLYLPGAYGAHSPVPSVSGREAVQRQLNKHVSLVNHTKEERFSIDIQMYARNERAFEHDVHWFMLRNKQALKKPPVWLGVQITYFQLFLAVYERGGYYQVSQNKQWGPVSREVCGCHTVSKGMQAKLYYQKNLLPYELYIKNEDYESSLQVNEKKVQRKEKPSLQSSFTKGCASYTRVAHSTSSSPACVPDVDHQARYRCDGDEESEATQKDLEEIDMMLSQLDHFDTASPIPYRNHGFEVTFFDESPPKMPTLHFLKPFDIKDEFQASSGHCAQEVPELPEYSDLVYTSL